MRLNLCNFDVWCKWHWHVSETFEIFWIWLNWLVVIMLSSPTALNPPQHACKKDAQSCSPKCQEPSTMAVYLGLFWRFFHLLHVFKEVETKDGILHLFCKNHQTKIGPETALSASKTCVLSRKSSIPHWYLLRFCSVQIESLTVRLFTLKFLCAMRYQYAFTFLKPPHVIDLQTPRYRCPSKRQLLRSALLWIPKCINVTSPRFPSTRTWQRREEINYKKKHRRFWDDDNDLNGCRRL